jgi:hypothetical protein
MKARAKAKSLAPITIAVKVKAWGRGFTAMPSIGKIGGCPPGTNPAVTISSNTDDSIIERPMIVLKRFLLEIIVYKPMQNKIIAVPWLNVIIDIFSTPPEAC